ncbi:hypothetical protein DFS34DRAFT_608297 [Phlyctochytrium arcticum]|nr:hypothetical protein DFS34DRAFT_608297 [Phlyctochytrium arcticum]
MRITPEILVGGSTQKRNKHESLETFLKRITHVSLFDKSICIMENLELCKNLTVLYLYDNKITEIGGLADCTNLTRLYLQNNAIEVLSGLHSGLEKLEVLHVHNNKIRRLENLENLKCLQSLKIDHQRLEQGDQFEIDSDCLLSISSSLRYLTIAGNGIEDISGLYSLSELVELDVSSNQVSDAKQFEILLRSCPWMVNLSTQENPAVRLGPPAKFRQRLLLASKSLECLNNKDINPIERKFLENMEQAQRARRLSRHSISSTAAHDAVMSSLGVGSTAHEEKPLPHLPPFATQYRDLMLQKIARPVDGNEARHLLVSEAASAAEVGDGFGRDNEDF